MVNIKQNGNLFLLYFVIKQPENSTNRSTTSSAVEKYRRFYFRFHVAVISGVV
jgi:hypothetical protein